MKYLETKHERNSAKITSLILLIIALLLFVVGPPYDEIPEEYGVAINFGENGDINNNQPDTPAQSEPDVDETEPEETLEEELPDEISEEDIPEEKLEEQLEDQAEELAKEELAKEAAEQEAAEAKRVAEEKAAEDLLAQEEAEALKIKKAEEIKKKEKLEKELLEKERLEKENAEKKAKAKAAAEAKSKADKIAKERAQKAAKAKAERDAKARAEKAAKDKAAREAKAKAAKAAAAKAAAAKAKSGGGDVVGFNLVEKMPVYPGCEGGDNAYKKKCMNEKLKTFVSKNFDQSIASEVGLKGSQKITIYFKIDATGRVVGISPRAADAKLKAEAKRVAKLLPRMKPGIQQGKAVIVPYSVSIRFQAKE